MIIYHIYYLWWWRARNICEQSMVHTNQEDTGFYKCKWKKAHEVHLFFGNQVAGLLPIKKEVIGRPVNMTLGVKVVDIAMEVKNTNVAPSWTHHRSWEMNPRLLCDW